MAKCHDLKKYDNERIKNMIKKLWLNRSEFYPYFTIYFFWLTAAFLTSLSVQNRPGIVTLGLITIPSILLITIAAIKTYVELPGAIEPGEKITPPYQHAFKYEPKHDKEKGFIYVAWIILLVVVLFSTYLHHAQPQILKVPSNTDVTSWENPAFKNTLIYERVTDAEKQKILSEGIPGSSLSEQFYNDIIIILLGVLCMVHAVKHFGLWIASCFFIGSFAFTGIQESMWILSGRFLSGIFTNPLGYTIHGSYWFTRGGFWFFETPLAPCIGWFFIAYTCVLVAGKVFPRMNLLGRAVIGGLIAMLIDMWMDPAITSPEHIAWVWAKGDFMLFFGIPVYNFMGWFWLITIFAVLWEKLPQMEEKWGRQKATLMFFFICLLSDIAIYLVIIMPWFVIAPNIAVWFGVDQTILIPPGW